MDSKVISEVFMFGRGKIWKEWNGQGKMGKNELKKLGDTFEVLLSNWLGSFFKEIYILVSYNM
jgi:hypothetical protein